MLKWLYAVIILALAAVVGWFAYLNAEPVTVDVYLRSVQLPLAALLALAFAAGIALATLVYFPRALSRRREIRRLRRAAQRSSEELAKLRSEPLQGAD